MATRPFIPLSERPSAHSRDLRTLTSAFARAGFVQVASVELVALSASRQRRRRRPARGYSSGTPVSVAGGLTNGGPQGFVPVTARRPLRNCTDGTGRAEAAL